MLEFNMSEQIQGERILTDQQLIDLHNDIRDGVSMIVECKHYEKLTKALNKAEVVLLNYAPKDMWFPEIKQQWSELMDEIHKLLGPEPKEPPKGK